MRKGIIVPIFLPYAGCKRRCVFCDQFTVSGEREVLPPWRIGTVVKKWEKYGRVEEIGFYGGTFTGLQKDLMISYLSSIREMYPHVRIRVSTRPDELEEEKLDILSNFGVEYVEVGVQTFRDEVLQACRRGYDGKTAVKALERLKSRGFTVGVHLMQGLPGNTFEDEFEDVKRVAKLKVDSCRLHPTLVFQDTPLHEMMFRGEYMPLSLSEALSRLVGMYIFLRGKGIVVNRIGLFLDENARKRLVAGPYHPALGHMVKAEAVFVKIRELIKDGRIRVALDKRYYPLLVGYRGRNTKRWKNSRIEVIVVFSKGFTVNDVSLLWLI